MDLYRESRWDRDITITTRLVEAASRPMRLDTVMAPKVDPTRLVTYRFELDKELSGLRDLRKRSRVRDADGTG